MATPLPLEVRDAAWNEARRWIAETSALLCWGQGDFLVTLWKGYFDDSDNERNLAVGGCVAPLDVWDRLTVAWVEVLREFDVCWFHATDFAKREEEFKTWKGDDKRCDEFYELLLGLIEKWRVVPVAYVIPADFNRPTPKPLKAGSQPKGFKKAVTARTSKILNDNYCKCLAWCLNAAAGLLTDEPPDVKLRVVIGDQPGKDGYIGILYRMAKTFASHRRRLGQELTT